LPAPTFPGKANLHFVFWVALFASIRWLKEAAVFEGRTLIDPRSLVCMALVLAAAAIVMRWLSEIRVRRARELIFEEESPAEMLSLRLNL
jgi:hypothetical protein